MKRSRIRLGDILSVLAVIVAVVALYFTSEERKAREESLRLTVKPIMSGYAVTLNFQRRPSVPTIWEIVGVNDCDRSMSILGYRLFELLPDGWLLHESLDQGMFDLSGNAIEFPLTLGPGQSFKYRLGVGVRVEEATFETLGRLYEHGERVQILEIRKTVTSDSLLSRSGSVTEEDLSQGDTMIPQSLHAHEEDNHILVEFITSRDNTFSCHGRWYW